MKKKHLLIPLIALSIVFALDSCKKAEQSVQKTKVNLSTVADSTVTIDSESMDGVEVTEEGYLKFDDKDAYQAYLDVTANYDDAQMELWETTMGFVSHYTAFNDPATYEVSAADNNNTLFADDHFLRIIDKHGIIQIGPYIFKAEYDNDLALEMHEEHKATYFDDLVAGTFISSVMNQLCSATEEDTDEDIFAVLETEVTGLLKTTGSTTGTSYNPPPAAYPLCGTGMGTNSGNNSTLKYNDDKKDIAQVTWRADCKAVYQSFIFYHSLMSEMKYMNGGPTLWTQKKTNIQYFTQWGSGCSFKPKGQGWQYPTPPNGVYDNKLTWRPWSKFKRLDKYDMNAIFGYTDCCGHTSTVQVRTYKP